MTLPSTPRRAGPFYGDGSTTQFPFTFKTYAREDIMFQVAPASGDTTTKVLDVDYLVTLNVDQVNSPGGYVTYPISGTPLQVGDTAAIGGNLDYSQPTALPEGGQYRARNVETMGDRIVMLVQQVAEKQDRSFTFPLTEGVIPEFPPIADRAGRLLGFDDNGQFIGVLPAAGSATQLAIDLASTVNATKGAGLSGYNPSLNYPASTVGFELNKRKSVFGTGVAATDVANIQAAINAAPDYTVLEFFGAFVTNANITVKPKIWLRANHATFTHTNNAADFLSYTPGSPTGFPGKIIVEGFAVTGPGNSGSANFVKIDANAPFVHLRQCYVGQFFGFAYLRDCYNAIVEQCQGYTFSHGVRLLRESHSFTWINTLLDGCTIAGVSVNYGGGAGTGPTHNVNLLGGAIQNGGTGVWAENCLGLHTVGLYHEGNAVNDYRIGVADGGAYNRPCYNVVIDGFESASPCASDGGRTVRVEHAVGWEVRAAAWNTGCSTTGTLLIYDGFSSRGFVSIQRFTTASPTGTAPVDNSADPTRCVVVYAGRQIHGAGVTDAISGGTLAAKLWALGHQSFGGRDSALLKSSQDVVLQVGNTGVVKVKDMAGADQFSFDIPLATSAPGAGSKKIWADPADGYRVKFVP